MNNFKTIGICGIGQMGASAAVAFKRAGYRVLLWARARDKLRSVAARLCDLEQWSHQYLGAHFWNPPHLIPLVEMVAGQATPPTMLDAACESLAHVGKIPIRCQDVPGFIGNRLMHAMWREALAPFQAEAWKRIAGEDQSIIQVTFADGRLGLVDANRITGPVPAPVAIGTLVVEACYRSNQTGQVVPVETLTGP
jgi:3-hydroxyacyl-CoA dehydrogenase-like protein